MKQKIGLTTPMSETMIYILLSLQEEMHGYGVMHRVKKMTQGRIVLGAGTIYQTLGKLEKNGLIQCIREEDRRKIYRSTPLGKEMLEAEKTRIHQLYQNLEAYL